MVVMIVVVGFAVIVYNSAQRKKHRPANIQRRKIIYSLADKYKYNVRQQGHYQAGGGHKLVRVHFARVVYLR